MSLNNRLRRLPPRPRDEPLQPLQPRPPRGRPQGIAGSRRHLSKALAKDRPDAFLPDLAMSLNNLGIRLSNLGRREDALKASQEAVDIYRALAKDRPGRLPTQTSR